VCAQSSQSPTDANRLVGLVEAASGHEPDGVVQVTADSGYFGGDTLLALEQTGIDTCIPDSYTARDMRRGLPVGSARADKAAMVYDAEGDFYRCANGRVLSYVQTIKQRATELKVYRAQAGCGDCPLRSECMTSATGKRRTLKVAVHRNEIDKVLKRFEDADTRQRYHDRGKDVETVFGFLRTALNFNRWMLRGKEKIASEAALVRVGYQIRKVHCAMVKAAHAPAT
jgi:hypothetical protein